MRLMQPLACGGLRRGGVNAPTISLHSGLDKERRRPPRFLGRPSACGEIGVLARPSSHCTGGKTGVVGAPRFLVSSLFTDVSTPPAAVPSEQHHQKTSVPTAVRQALSKNRDGSQRQ